jgi:hypothetical protein
MLLSELKAVVDSLPDHHRKEVIRVIKSVIRTLEPILHPAAEESA